MRQAIENRDIRETVSLVADAELEDAIFCTMEKLQALCVVQAELEANECALAPKTRVHFAMVMEQQVGELRRLLEKQFS